MQLLIITLVIGIFLHDMSSPEPGRSALTGWGLLACVFLPKLALAGLYGTISWKTNQQLGAAHGHVWLRLHERFGVLYRYLAILLYGMDVYFGALSALRQHFVDTVLLDEVLFMLPTLLVMAWSWWAYYPIDRGLRETALIRRIDAGLPVQAIWSRGQYMLAQFRHQIAMILIPLLVILAWEEAVRSLAPQMVPGLASNPQALLIVIGAGCVFLVAPVMIRHIWDTTSLPDSHLRQRLLSMCRHYRIGFRELLLWRTFGGMINAAVMGVFAPVRYILLTDALLEMLPQDQVEAVMAHELAHIKKHHLFWLLVVAIAMLGALQLAWVPLVAIAAAMTTDSMLLPASAITWLSDDQTMAVAGIVATLGCWLPAFGWVSRRFERQADTFAVLHMARQQAEAAASTETSGTIQRTNSLIMTQALHHVADLNSIALHRRSWRHGSIAWRQGYLRDLVGQPIGKLAIDSQVQWIKIASALTFGLVIAIDVGLVGVVR